MPEDKADSNEEELEKQSSNDESRPKQAEADEKNESAKNEP